MGLFIGASVLTLLEILDYIYEARGGALVGATQMGSGGEEEGLGGKQRGSAGFLVELDWREVKLRVIYQGPLTGGKARAR